MQVTALSRAGKVWIRRYLLAPDSPGSGTSNQTLNPPEASPTASDRSPSRNSSAVTGCSETLRVREYRGGVRAPSRDHSTISPEAVPASSRRPPSTTTLRAGAGSCGVRS